jgi:hypothetical protein
MIHRKKRRREDFFLKRRSPSTLLLFLFTLNLPPRTAVAQEAGCVVTWSEARFDGGGYDHWVSVSNECGGPVYCSVWTDVNPNPQVVPLEEHQVVQVLTFRASPARVFTPQVVCGFRSGR